MITIEAELPVGAVLSTERGPFVLKPELKEHMAVISLAKSKEKECWIIASPKYIKSIHLLQLKQQVEGSEYKVVQQEAADEAIIRLLYDKDRQLNASIKEQRQDSKVIAYFDDILADALREEISDIHLEKRAHNAIIKMRKHGEMLEYRELSPAQAFELASVVYNVLADEKDVVFNDLDYQVASINRVIEGLEVKLRYQALPVYPKGFDVVLRVLPIGKNEDYVPLEKLGYAPSHITMLMEIVSRPVGALIIAGTTGSGKSTTLKNLLMYVHAERGYRDKIYTVEDPPEYKIPRVSQIPVIRRKNDDYTNKSPFEDPIRACMRADPDILMIGEVRDRATGDLLKKAVQSGHQVLTTVHAASALAIVDRFTDFDIQRSVLGSQEFISGLCYQKLVPLICPHCSIRIEDVVAQPDAQESDIMLFERVLKVCDLNKDTIKLRRHTGCDRCANIGVIGRTVCAEIIAPDLKLLEFFRDAKNTEAHKYWKGLSDKDTDSWNMIGKTAMEHAALKMRKGFVSPHEVEAAFGLLTILNQDKD